MSPTTSASSGDTPTPPAAPRASRFSRAAHGARRWLFLIHRWLGVALALLMALWTLSGFVMMYVSYPETSAAERVAGLDPLELSGCCEDLSPPGVARVESATVEMVRGEPTLRWIGEESGGLIGLTSGSTPFIDEREAGEIARTHMRNAFGVEPPVQVEPVDVDQWTLQLRRYAPLYKASFADGRGTVLYVSGASGEVVQDTHRSERFWNWLGAVPHWLYFTPLRQDGALWSEVVIYASLLGTFLTVTGLYIGMITWRRGKRWSPFRGIALWHHWTGLVFGLATLTWVFSGFASMQPWGWLESEGPGAELRALAGRQLEGRDVAALYQALAAHPQPDAVSAEVVVQGGTPFAILVGRAGSRRRASLPDLAPAPLSEVDLAALARSAKPDTSIASQGLIATGDAYHYDHHSTPAVLPAYRAIYSDSEETRLYLDPHTGELVNFVDAGSRGFRWWHLSLHRLDLPGLRERPLWDIVTLTLLAGVASLCLIGVWLGVRRLRRTLLGAKGVF